MCTGSVPEINIEWQEELQEWIRTMEIVHSFSMIQKIEVFSGIFYNMAMGGKAE